MLFFSSSHLDAAEVSSTAALGTMCTHRCAYETSNLISSPDVGSMANMSGQQLTL